MVQTLLYIYIYIMFIVFPATFTKFTTFQLVRFYSSSVNEVASVDIFQKCFEEKESPSQEKEGVSKEGEKDTERE